MTSSQPLHFVKQSANGVGRGCVGLAYQYRRRGSSAFAGYPSSIATVRVRLHRLRPGTAAFLPQTVGRTVQTVVDDRGGGGGNLKSELHYKKFHTPGWRRAY